MQLGAKRVAPIVLVVIISLVLLSAQEKKPALTPNDFKPSSAIQPTQSKAPKGLAENSALASGQDKLNAVLGSKPQSRFDVSKLATTPKPTLSKSAFAVEPGIKPTQSRFEKLNSSSLAINAEHKASVLSTIKPQEKAVKE